MIKAIAVVKMFIVLCCYTQSDTDRYKYEVRSIGDSTQTGIIFSFTKYQEGDTIKIQTQQVSNN